MNSGRAGKNLLKKYQVTKDMLAHLHQSEDSDNSDESLEEYWN